jgi:hypothetical protein
MAEKAGSGTGGKGGIAKPSPLTGGGTGRDGGRASGGASTEMLERKSEELFPSSLAAVVEGSPSTVEAAESVFFSPILRTYFFNGRAAGGSGHCGKQGDQREGKDGKESNSTYNAFPSSAQASVATTVVSRAGVVLRAALVPLSTEKARVNECDKGVGREKGKRTKSSTLTGFASSARVS